VKKVSFYKSSFDTKCKKGLRYLQRNWQYYLLLTPVVLYFLIFKYAPMFGLQIAFKDYGIRKGVWNSPWVGIDHFTRFFNSYKSGQVIKNTLMISIYTLLLSTPAPILLALLLNEANNKWFKRVVQTITYSPYFISTVVLCSMVLLMLSYDYGIVNKFITFFGGEKQYFMSKPQYFKTIYALSTVWQTMGWNSIIYIAALTGIDPQLHEAAMIDGAGRLRRIWHINIPGILPTFIILLIMNSGTVMNVGFEKVFLLQNDLNLSASEVISTYVYQQGLIQNNFSYSTAVGLFNSIVNCAMLLTVNQIARTVSDTSLW